MGEDAYTIVETWREGNREEEGIVAVSLDRDDAEWLSDRLGRELGREFVVRVLPLHTASLVSLAALVREYQD